MLFLLAFLLRPYFTSFFFFTLCFLTFFPYNAFGQVRSNDILFPISPNPQLKLLDNTPGSSNVAIANNNNALLTPFPSIVPIPTAPSPSPSPAPAPSIETPSPIVIAPATIPPSTPSLTPSPPIVVSPSPTPPTSSTPLPPNVQTVVVVPPTNTATPPSTALPPNTIKPPSSTSPCSSGVCNVPNRGTCISMENTGICSAFANMYLPTKLNAYFAARFPNRDSSKIPIIENGETFNNLFGDKEYSFMSKYASEYAVFEHGCSTPNQRWFVTWFCIDLLVFYANANDPCAANQRPSICSSTLSSRADSLQADLDNRETCLVPPEAKTKGQQFVNYLRAFPWASQSAADSRCISGELNENGANNYRKCGWFSELTACKNENTCPSMDKSLSARCPSILANQASTATPTTPSDTTHASLIVSVSVAVLALACLLIGLRSLSSIRTTSDDQKKDDPLPPPSLHPIKPNVLPSPELTSVVTPHSPSPLRPLSLAESTRSSVLQNYYRSSTASSLLFSPSAVGPRPTPASLAMASPRPASMSALPVAYAAPTYPPSHRVTSMVSELSSPSLGPASPVLAPFARGAPLGLATGHPEVGAPLASLPTAPVFAQVARLAPVAPTALPAKADPKKRPPNSRADLQPMLSPIPPTPSDEVPIGFFRSPH